MGAGIWSMHFVGMLAFEMSMPMTYQPYLTALSLLIAILASAFGLFLFKNVNKPKLFPIFGGIFVGLGIAAMHYTGMAAMENVIIRYHVSLFVLSIIIAIIASEAALGLVVLGNRGSLKRRVRLKASSALVMGAAICGMHYVGMAAAIFYMPTNVSIVHQTSINPTVLAMSITLITIVIMAIAITTSTFKQLLSTALEKEREFLKALLNNLADGILACDAKGKITLFNSAAQNFHNSKQAFDKHWQDLNCLTLDGKKIPPEQMPLQIALKHGVVEGMELVVPPTESSVSSLYLKVDGQSIFNTEGEKLGAVIAMHNITKQKQLEQLLIKQATHDPLTNLPNRLVLYDRIEQSIKQAKRENHFVSVLFIDLDRFKNINDQKSHDIGDDVLKETAKRLLKCVREGDTIARIGGDEFIAILSNHANENENILIAQRILKTLREPYIFEKNKVNITASIGICTYPDNGHDAETLVHNADIAMYRAKSDGGNCFHFYNPEINVRATQQVFFETHLQHALERHEFVLHYQPIIDVKTGAIVSAEALIRWKLPEMGLVPPMEFIPLAEETGLIVPIGEWVLRTACAQNKAWQDKGLPPMSISVNLSSVQFQQQAMEDVVKRVLDETGLDPCYLDLEITESMILENTSHIMQSLKKIKDMGVHIIIDDFGTGYSSLSYLKKFPIEKIKIDSSFVRDLAHSEDAAIILAVIALANSLKMKVIAEGAETAKQLGFLCFNRCDEIQGFYFSKPLEAHEFETLLRKHQNFKDMMNFDL
jgi:diguanylate cyclase (GGDEF)-like protein/PAS domain S-box-containing protein